MRKTDISIEGKDDQPIMLWSVTMNKQSDSEDRTFALFDSSGAVEIQRWCMDSYGEVLKWDPDSDDKVMLVGSRKRALVRHIRVMLDQTLANSEIQDTLNVYVVRDHFDMSFGLIFTERTLSDDPTYSIENYKTLSESMMENM